MNTNSNEALLQSLKRPFAPSLVSWRVGARNKDKTKGQTLAYIDARDVMLRLDQVCGLNWQCRYPLADNGLLICEIGIKIDGEWIWRSNGAGDTQVEAEKGKCSDAFKRAAVNWGIGRYLYELQSPWVELENGYLPRNFTPPALPAWATPEGFDALMERRNGNA